MRRKIHPPAPLRAERAARLAKLQETGVGLAEFVDPAKLPPDEALAQIVDRLGDIRTDVSDVVEDARVTKTFPEAFSVMARYAAIEARRAAGDLLTAAKSFDREAKRADRALAREAA